MEKSKSRKRRQALAEARDRFAQTRPYGRRLHNEASKWLPGGNTRTVLYHQPFPLSVEAAAGPYIWDHDGHKYIDLLNDHTAGLFGHSDRIVSDAVREALARGINSCGNGQAEVEVAALLCRRFKSIEKVRFTPSGTEANLMALSLARIATDRDTIVVFQGAYHGSGLLFREGHLKANLPFKFVILPYNNVPALECAFAQERDVAAILIEPMLGSGGCIPATAPFLDAARQISKVSGALLIFDEVMTSRLAWGGLQTKRSISPDLTTLGKYLAGGLPIGAFGGHSDIMDFLDPSKPDSINHSGTFNNNILSMSAAAAALRSFGEAEILAINALGDRLREDLNRIAAEKKVDACFSGDGSMLHFHASASPPAHFIDSTVRDEELRALLYLNLLEEGVRVSPKGFISLSRQNDREHCAALVSAFARFLESCADCV